MPRLVQKMERALDQSTKTLNTIDSVFGDAELRDGLKRSLKDLPEMFDKTKTVLDKASVTFDDFRKVTERADRNMSNLEKITGPLAERGQSMTDDLTGILSNVNNITEQINELTDNFSNREGTLGRLLNDDELYDRLERTLANVEDLTFKMRPILDDARIVSDKLARDPSIIGVRGILDRRTLGAGQKASTFDSPADYHAPISHGSYRRNWADDGEY